MDSFARPLLVVAAMTVGIWLLGQLLGYRLALFPSLAISLMVTAALNLGRLRSAWRESR